MTRHRFRARLLLGALLAGALAEARAEEAETPLAESRKAIKQLQKEQAQGTPGVDDPMRGAFPEIAAPDLGTATGAAPPAPPSERRREEEAKKRRAQKNWLVEGVLGLERNRPEALLPGEDDEEPLEASDPDFLLKTYIKEQQAREEARQKSGRTPASAADDPMAPFLREWLSGSPVERTALAGLAGGARSESGLSAANTTGSSPSTATAPVLFDAVPLGSTETAIREPAGNPFLQGLDFRDLALAGAVPQLPSPPAGPVLTPAAPAAAVSGAPAGPAREPAATARDSERKPPRSTLEENEKYFRQQKKF